MAEGNGNGGLFSENTSAGVAGTVDKNLDGALWNVGMSFGIIRLQLERENNYWTFSEIVKVKFGRTIC